MHCRIWLSRLCKCLDVCFTPFLTFEGYWDEIVVSADCSMDLSFAKGSWKMLFCPLEVGRSQGPDMAQSTWGKISDTKTIVSVAHSERIYFLFPAIMFSKLDGENNPEFQMVRIQNQDTEMLFFCVLQENKSSLSRTSDLDRVYCDFVQVRLREFCAL